MLDEDEDDSATKGRFYGAEFCPHPGQPCIDGCHFCGTRLPVDEHNHTQTSKTGEEPRYGCVCENC